MTPSGSRQLYVNPPLLCSRKPTYVHTSEYAPATSDMDPPFSIGTAQQSCACFDLSRGRTIALLAPRLPPTRWQYDADHAMGNFVNLGAREEARLSRIAPR